MNIKKCISSLAIAATCMIAAMGFSTEAKAASVSKAAAIEVNHGYRAITKTVDQDNLYKFTTPSAGQFRIEFWRGNSVDSKDVGNGWKLTVRDENMKQIGGYYSDVAAESTKLETTVFPYDAGTFYLEVENDTPNSWYAPINCTYYFKVVFETKANWESENNDLKKDADVIKFNTTYKGITKDDNDTDYFKFTMSKPGIAKINLKADEVENDTKNGWKYSLCRYSDNTEMGCVRNIETTNTSSFKLQKGTYYIKVENQAVNNCWYSARECIYNLKVSAKYATTPSATSITSITAGKNKLTLKWKKVANATGYYIYRSTKKNSGFKKIKTIKSGSTVSFVNKSLKAKKKYFYKIYAFNTCGFTVKSKASAVVGKTTK